jgi:Trk K+ transport system NAD-binding subunit
METNWKRAVRAQLRDTRVLLHESRSSLILFFILILSGALLFHFFYTYPGTNQHPSFAEALHATFALIFFEVMFPFPKGGLLQLLYFVIPIIGLVVIADGLVRFGGALINKQARGQNWQVAMASTFREHIIVCGMGKVGYRVTLELLKFGREVVAIEIDPEGRFVEKAQALKIPMIIANARRSENLIKAGVKWADAIIPCTNDELTNLDIALDARELQPDIKIVMRMFDTDLARRVGKGFDIQTAFSTSSLAAPIFASAAMRLNIKHSFYVGEELLGICEFRIGSASPLIGWGVDKIEREFDLSVVRYQGAEMEDFHPRSEVELTAGDTILVLAALDQLQQVQALNETAKDVK